MGKRSGNTAADVIAESEAQANGTPGIMRSSTDWIPERQLEEIVRDFYRRRGTNVPADGIKFGLDDAGMVFCTVEAPQQPFAFKTRQRRSKTAE